MPFMCVLSADMLVDTSNPRLTELFFGSSFSKTDKRTPLLNPE